MLSWIDYYHDNQIIRKFNNNTVVFNKTNNINIVNSIKEIDIPYNFPSMKQLPVTHIKDDKIGVIDLETYTSNFNGAQKVYAGGWAVNGECHTYYIEEVEGLNSIALVQHIFNQILNSQYNNYTFYIHNLSGFDYVFILDALSRDDFNLDPIIKDDNTLVSLKISKNIKIKVPLIVEDGYIDENPKFISKNVNKKIKLLDSNLMIEGSMINIAIDFNCKIKKGHLPYKFVNKDKLFYKGETPCYKYFENYMKIDEYNKIYSKHNYDLKRETLEYLKSDLLSLLEIVNIFGPSNDVYDKFGLNITDSKTASSLSLKTYLSTFYKNKYNIKIIRGNIEDEIRKAYYGGIIYIPEGGLRIIRNYKLLEGFLTFWNIKIFFLLKFVILYFFCFCNPYEERNYTQILLLLFLTTLYCNLIY